MDSQSYLVPPYACAYSNGRFTCFYQRSTTYMGIKASKQGKQSVLAVATEEGTVDILNTSKRNDWDPGDYRRT